MTPVIQASGMPSYIYRIDEFTGRCGVNPLDYPKFFAANKNGYIYATPAFRNYCNAHYAQVKRNWHSLGINA